MATQTPLGLIKPDRDENYDIGVFNQNSDKIDELLNKLVNTTYSELKTLRDTSKLVPGQQYRITDYETIINGNITSGGVTKQLFRSAGHRFDIIVIADSTNTLNENARAMKHDGDIYFNNSNLNAWQLKYSLDHKANYTWSSSSGKGLIYYMKDERNNIAGYDFKNIQMKRFKITAVDLTSLDVFNTGTINTKYKTNCIDAFVGHYLGMLSITNLSVIKGDIITIDENDYKWVYSINNTSDDYATCTDYSLNTNRIELPLSFSIPNISFQGVSGASTIVDCHIPYNDCLNNAFEGNCYRLNIGGYFQNNICTKGSGNVCITNTLIENFNSNCLFCGNITTNHLGNNNNNNIYLYSSVNNTIGNYNTHNIWSIDSALVGNENTYIYTGEDCDNWHVGNGNSYIETGSNCEQMFFGNACGGSLENAIRMGDANLGHIFLGYNRAITLGDNLEMCLFKNFTRAITITNTSTTKYGHITLGVASGNKTFNQGTNYINVANSDIVSRTYTTADNNKVSSNATSVNVTIPISGWTLDSTTQVYSQTISVPGMYSTYSGSKAFDFVRPTRDASYLTNLDTIEEQVSNITDIVPGNGSITVYIKEVPTLAFQIILYGV